MRGPTRTVLVLALSFGLLAACGRSGMSAGGPGSPPHDAGVSLGEHNVLPPVTSGRPVFGGTLRIQGNGDVDHLDTCCAYYGTTYGILRALDRQLVSYPSKPGTAIGSTTPVPDLATYTEDPHSTVFTFHIKSGVMWDTPNGARQVTSQDEVRGLERLCNPVSPAPPLSYWEDNIKGMMSFCSGFQALKLSTDPATEIRQLQAYMASNSISGLSAPDPSTLVITLRHPATSFINIMALPMSSPVPVEIMNYLPASVEEEQSFISDGPYKLDSYTPNVSMRLSRNPYWRPATDSLRHRYWDAIDVTEGLQATSVQQALEIGSADLEWDTAVPPADVESLYHDPHFIAVFSGAFYYLAFNRRSTTDNDALQKLQVRQALQYCVNKRHLVQVSGGPEINVIANQILPPQITGYRPIDPYPTTGGTGSSARCRSMLAAAGYATGLSLTLTYPNNPPAPAQFQALQADFADAGVTLKSNEQPTQGGYFTYISTPSNKVNWDLAWVAWSPDWQGDAAQSIFSPLLDGRFYGNGSSNVGDYNDSTVNADIDRALTAPTVSQAASVWAAADAYVMTTDPAWIPMLYTAIPQYSGRDVRNVIYNSFLGNVDVTQTFR